MQNPDIRDIEKLKALGEEYAKELANRTTMEKTRDMIIHIFSPHVFLLIGFIVIFIILMIAKESKKLDYISMVTYLALIDVISFHILYHIKHKQLMKELQNIPVTPEEATKVQ